MKNIDVVAIKRRCVSAKYIRDFFYKIKKAPNFRRFFNTFLISERNIFVFVALCLSSIISVDFDPIYIAFENLVCTLNEHR